MEVTLDDLPLLGTLERLRRRIIASLVCGVLLSVAGWFVTRDVMEFLVSQQVGLGELVFLSPSEAFFTRLKLAAALGFVAAVPFIGWQIRAAFIPVMSERERRLSLWLFPGALLLFYGGIAFAVMAVLPIALRFLLGFGGDQIEPMIRVASFIGFVITFSIPFAIVFQMPVVVFFLARMGILTPTTLRRSRRVSIFVIFVIATLLTPADIFSQLLMAGPMFVLYEVSILLAGLATRE